MAEFTLCVTFISVVLCFLIGLTTGLSAPALVAVLVLMCDCLAANLAENDRSPIAIFAMILNVVFIFFGMIGLESVISVIIRAFASKFLFKVPEYLSYILTIVITGGLFLFLRKQAERGQLLLQIAAEAVMDRLSDRKAEFETSSEDLKKWKQLYDEGTITEEIYERKRQEILQKKNPLN